MIICQTLWTNKKKLIENDFGWLSPQHHIIAWALSCLQLRKFYEQVDLYTDSVGADILIESLNLPYTNVFTSYDNLICNPVLWAYPKVITFSKQDSPFIHVDGDVIIWKSFKQKVEEAVLIAQNLEVSTQYYDNLFSAYKSKLFYYPNYLKKNLFSGRSYSYNAGVLGGSSIDFFKQYRLEAERIIRNNKRNQLDSNFNIILEQLLFYSLAKKRNDKVACIYDKEVNDNGYSHAEFANFPMISQLSYLHFIGNHKRNKQVCDWMSNFLYNEYPETFSGIMTLFKKTHFHFSKVHNHIGKTCGTSKPLPFTFSRTVELLNLLTKTTNNISHVTLKRLVNNSHNSMLKSLYNYEKKVYNIILKFNKLDFTELDKQLKETVLSTNFFIVSDKEKENSVLYINPHLEVIHSVYDWTNMQIVDNSIQLNSSYKKDNVIAIVPQLLFKGYNEVLLDELCVNIILKVSERPLFSLLLNELKQFFGDLYNPKNNSDFFKLIMIKFDYLISNRILFVKLK